VQEWSREFEQFERAGNLPAFEIMRLPNDHTAGTTPGRLTPQEYMAENDQGRGEVVDLVSHSGDWPTTAIFGTEDDAQNGPTTSMRTAPSRWSSVPTRSARSRLSITRSTTPALWCEPWC
jgi:hypothetical protein